MPFIASTVDPHLAVCARRPDSQRAGGLACGWLDQHPLKFLEEVCLTVTVGPWPELTGEGRVYACANPNLRKEDMCTRPSMQVRASVPC